MAKPGDVVEFKPGLFGIAPPGNLAIVLDRWRRKGVAMVRLATIQGVKEVKQENLTRRAFKQRFEGDVGDPDAALARLRQLASLHGAGQLAEEAEDDLGRLEEALWEATNRLPAPLSEEEIAQAHYGEPSPQQLRDARAALERCRRPGRGRFETAGRGDRWRPWTPDEVATMRRAWQDLQDVRARLVAVEEGEGGRTFRGVAVAEADLTDADRAVLDWVCAAMAQYVEHDGVPSAGIAGIGGLGAVQAFGMDLHRALGFLAQDWLGQHASQSSDYVIFLLGTGLWTPADAVASLTRRHVNQEPFFEHVPDAHAEQAAADLPEPAEEPGRTDLRHLECFTIDPPDARDFDDAVGLEVGGGRQRLWVHIADVSHYVRPDTVLDAHAKKRATSVYLPGRVLPMLPTRLADHLCSLRSDGDRFAVSVALDVDAEGRITGTAFHASLIRVTQNLTYADALARRDAGDAAFAALFDLAARLRRHRRGPALDTGERRVLLEDTGFTATEKRADDATQMIETFMVAANEAVAAHLAREGVGLLFRCHPLPDAAKAERFQHQLATMGINVDFTLPKTARRDAGPSLLERLQAGGKMELFGGALAEAEPHAEAPPAPGFASLDREQQDAWLAPFHAVVGALAALADRGLADVATLKMLACMGQAYYTPQNEGHFGLGLEHYCHFTSPIRRYPDLVVHRNLKWLLSGRSGEPPHPTESLASMSDHCSEQERAADALERRVKAACLVLATLGRDSETGARITGITPASVFVQRDDGIEARVPGREIPGGPYHVDEWESMLFREDGPGERWEDPETGEIRLVRARLGDRVAARLAARHVAEGKTEARITWR